MSQLRNKAETATALWQLGATEIGPRGERHQYSSRTTQTIYREDRVGCLYHLQPAVKADIACGLRTDIFTNRHRLVILTTNDNDLHHQLALHLDAITMQRFVHLSKVARFQHTGFQLSRPQAFLCKHALTNPHLPACGRPHYRCMASFGGGDGRDKRDNEPTLGEIGTELLSKVK